LAISPTLVILVVAAIWGLHEHIKDVLADAWKHAFAWFKKHGVA